MHRGIGRAFQVANCFPTMTVAENLMAAVTAHIGQWGNLSRRFPSPGVRERAEEVMELVGLTQVPNVEAAILSHGDQKLLDIAIALALEPRVLLLDEPTAGMGPDERWRMIERVRRICGNAHSSRWSSSSTTWISSSKSPIPSACCAMAAFWPKAHRTISATTRR